MNQADIDRFMGKIVRVPEGGCWVWEAGIFSGYGYGQFSYKDGGGHRNIAAHRFSYMAHVGQIPNGMCVCHRCDNPQCVNPHHLFLGTALDNNRDRARKNRSFRPAGSLKTTAKLSDEIVATLRAMPKLSLSAAKELAHQYGVSWRHLYKVRSGERWLVDAGASK